MYCTRCGAKLDNESRFCTRCGSPVDSGTPSSEKPSSTHADTEPKRPSMPFDEMQSTPHDSSNQESAPSPLQEQISEIRGRSRKRISFSLLVTLIVLGIATVAVAAVLVWKLVIEPGINNRQTEPTALQTQSISEPAATSPETQESGNEDFSTIPYDTGYFTFNMPAIWKGKVKVLPVGNTSGIYHVEFLYGERNAILWRVNGTTPPMSKDVSIVDGEGSFYGDQAASEVWALTHGKKGDIGLSEQEAVEWLYLTTGGALDKEKITSMEDAEAARQAGKEASTEFYDKTVGDSIVMAKAMSGNDTTDKSATTTSNDTHIVADHYTLDVPEAWRNTTKWSVDGDTVSFTSNKAGNKEFLRLEFPFRGTAGDASGGFLMAVPIETDADISSMPKSPYAEKAVAIYAPYLVMQTLAYVDDSLEADVRSLDSFAAENGVSQDDLATLLELQTGGTRDSMRGSNYDAVINEAEKYLTGLLNIKGK